MLLNRPRARCIGLVCRNMIPACLSLPALGGGSPRSLAVVCEGGRRGGGGRNATGTVVLPLTHALSPAPATHADLPPSPWEPPPWPPPTPHPFLSPFSVSLFNHLRRSFSFPLASFLSVCLIPWSSHHPLSSCSVSFLFFLILVYLHSFPSTIFLTSFLHPISTTAFFSQAISFLPAGVLSPNTRASDSY